MNDEKPKVYTPEEVEARIAESGLEGWYFDADGGWLRRKYTTDGWQATQLAWRALFGLVVILRCFLHGWLSLRDGCKKHPLFATLSEKVWHAYHARDRRTFGQRLRRLREWALARHTTKYRAQTVLEAVGFQEGVDY